MITDATSRPATPGTTREAVAGALPAGGMASLPGRALLARRPDTPAWHGSVVGWLLRLLLRGCWTILQARWVAAARFDLRLAVARWRRGLHGTALVQLDGLWLRYGQEGMALLVACPDGDVPHAVPVADLTELGELVLAAQADPLLPPWACPEGCPARNPAAAGVTDLSTRRAR
jgi:hypothetical protein